MHFSIGVVCLSVSTNLQADNLVALPVVGLPCALLKKMHLLEIKATCAGAVPDGGIPRGVERMTICFEPTVWKILDTFSIHLSLPHCSPLSSSPLPEVVEHACSITSLMLGETLPSITKDMDTYTYRLPIGVCAGIAPFNFPAMIPLWMFPIGMVCGNTYLMKPSERVPGCTMLLAKMLQDAGAPDGTLNIIHGQHAGE